MELIPSSPARSLGRFQISEAGTVIEIIMTSTGRVAMTRDGRVCDAQADPAVAEGLARRVLAGDADVLTLPAMKAISMVLVAAFLAAEAERAAP